MSGSLGDSGRGEHGLRSPVHQERNKVEQSESANAHFAGFDLERRLAELVYDSCHLL